MKIFHFVLNKKKYSALHNTKYKNNNYINISYLTDKSLYYDIVICGGCY